MKKLTRHFLSTTLSTKTDGREGAMEEGRRKGRATGTGRTGPAASTDSDSSDGGVHHKMLEQKMEDDKLLRDAGIAVEDMGEDEKREILEALRQSLPAQAEPLPSSSRHLPPSVEDKDSKEELAELPEDGPRPARSPQDQGSGEESAGLPEDPLPDAVSVRVVPVQCDRQRGQECDSTTASVSSPGAGDREVSVAAGVGVGQVLSGRTEDCGQVADQLSDADSESDLSDCADAGDMDLLARSTKRLSHRHCQDIRLSHRQKEQGQRRFKELFNRTRLSQSTGSSQSPGRGGGPGSSDVHSSQDLFTEPSFGQSDDTQPEEPSSQGSVLKERQLSGRSSAPVTSRRAPSPSIPSSPTQEEQLSPGNGEEEKETREEEGVQMEDETQPPEGIGAEEEEEEEVECVGSGDDMARQAEEDVHSSPVYPMQEPPASCSSPAHSQTSADPQHLTPSKLPVDDKTDQRPLVHDNCFSWPPVPPVCCLHRTYRMNSKKRKEPPSEGRPYFCPEREGVAAYTEVIMCMMDAYLQRFSAVQRCLHTVLPWGKPVRAGLCQPRSLDCRRRGRPALLRDLDTDTEEEEDDDDFEARQPPRKRLSTQRRNRLDSEDDVPADSNTASRAKAGVTVGKGGSSRKPGDGGDSAEEAAAYHSETQPLDSDSDLPDLVVEGVEGAEGSWSGRQNKEEGRTPSPSPGAADSQSSGCLLNEQGDLYSTQLPSRKRAGLPESQAAATRPKRLCCKVAPAGMKWEATVKPEKHRPLSRKRKQQHSPAAEDSKVRVLDTDDEEKEEEEDKVSSPQTKEVVVKRKRTGYLHISSRVEGRATRSAVVPPLPQGSHTSEGGSGRFLPVGKENGGNRTLQPPDFSAVSSSSDVRGAGDAGEDSGDSVQFLEPACHTEGSAPPPSSASQRAGLVGDGEDDEEEDAAAGPLALKPAGTVDSSGPEELIACPLCSKLFALSVIERHASDCSLEVDREQPHTPPLSTAPIPLPPVTELKRRPLRGQHDREEFVCGLCHANLGGSGALKRHFEACRQKHQRELASCSSQQELRGERSRPGVTSQGSARDRWLSSYKIPKRREVTSSSARASEESLHRGGEEEEEEVIEEGSEDSDKAPDSRPAEEGRRRGKDKQEEGRWSGSRPSHRP